MLVEEIMTTQVLSIKMDTRMKEIGKLFSRKNFHHLIILEDEKVVGVISDKDYLRAISPFIATYAETERDTDILKHRAHHIMTRHPVCVKPQDEVTTVIQIFLEKKFSCLPVVDSEQHLKGILTLRDIAKVAMEELLS